MGGINEMTARYANRSPNTASMDCHEKRILHGMGLVTQENKLYLSIVQFCSAMGRQKCKLHLKLQRLDLQTKALLKERQSRRVHMIRHFQLH